MPRQYSKATSKAPVSKSPSSAAPSSGSAMKGGYKKASSSSDEVKLGAGFGQTGLETQWPGDWPVKK